MASRDIKYIAPRRCRIDARLAIVASTADSEAVMAAASHCKTETDLRYYDFASAMTGIVFCDTSAGPSAGVLAFSMRVTSDIGLSCMHRHLSAILAMFHAAYEWRPQSSSGDETRAASHATARRTTPMVGEKSAWHRVADTLMKTHMKHV